jgi:hypothetical protein
MQPNEKTNEKINQQLSTQPNEQPKKTWEDPAMTLLDINSGRYQYPAESGSVAGPQGSLPWT